MRKEGRRRRGANENKNPHAEVVGKALKLFLLVSTVSDPIERKHSLADMYFRAAVAATTISLLSLAAALICF